MIPVVNGLKSEYRDQVAFKSLHANEGNGQTVFERLNLPGHPSVVLFNADGKEVYRGFGAIPEALLRARLDEVSAADPP